MKSEDFDQLPDPLSEVAARADAAQKVALAALEEVVRMSRGEKQPIDLIKKADDLESHSFADRNPIERRGRTIAAGLLRTLSDVLESKP